MSSNTAVSVWERGRLDTRVGPRQVLFGRMYEDPRIELEVFRAGSRVVCIASAGCMAMKLAPHHEVVAVDINPVQLAYAERRFDGAPCIRGRAEHIMDFMRFFAPLAGWWPSKVRAFVELEDTDEQMHYWEKELNTWRFRAAIDGLFSLTALRSFYAPPLLDFLPKHLGSVMRARMARCFSTHPNCNNPYARSLLLGELPSDPAPVQAKDIMLVHADVASFLESQPVASFDGFTLSNILDGTDQAYQQRLFAAVKRAGKPDAITILRSFSESDADSPFNRAKDEQAMLWGSVLVRPACEL